MNFFNSSQYQISVSHSPDDDDGAAVVSSESNCYSLQIICTLTITKQTFKDRPIGFLASFYDFCDRYRY